jgi:hypothetical protein
VSLAVVNERLHACAVGQEQGGHLFHASRDYPSSGAVVYSMPFVDLDGVLGGQALTHVACAGVQAPGAEATSIGSEQLHVCALNSGGELLHGILAIAAIGEAVEISPFQRVNDGTGVPGRFDQAVDCAGDSQVLHVVALAETGDGSGRAMHTTRGPRGSWAPAVDVMNISTPAGSWLGNARSVGIGFCNESVPNPFHRNVSQLNVGVVTSSGALAYTVRAANPVQWSPVWPESQWRPVEFLDQTLSFAPVSRVTSVSITERPFAP